MGNYDIEDLNEIAKIGGNDENGDNATSTWLTIPFSISMTATVSCMITVSVEESICC